MKYVLLILLWSSAGVRAQTPAGIPRSPDYFHAEKRIRRQVPLPPAVIRSILKQEGGAGERDAFQHMRRRLKGTFIQLDRDAGRELLVQGDEGANSTGFWIFERKGKAWRLVLADRGLSLELKKMPAAGHRVVEVDMCQHWGCYSRRYRFQQDVYRPFSCRLQTDSGIRRISCAPYDWSVKERR